jgi:DNA repair exonuclease SbcCD ATPase subunit
MEAIQKAFASLEKEMEKIKKLINSTDSDAESVKLTPAQKLEKRLDTAVEKLAKLNEKIEGGKSKIPDKDAENKAKLEETISELRTKISSKDKPKDKPEVTKKSAEEKPKVKKPEDESSEDAPEVKPVEKKPKAEKPADKNLATCSPAKLTQLKSSFEKNGVPWSDDYKKAFLDKMNALTAADYSVITLEVHMDNYAKSFHTKAESGGGGGGSKIKVLTVSELKTQNKNLKETSAGIFQHKTTGEIFMGPDEDPEEDFDDAAFNDEDFKVGETTKRVYTQDDEEFVGYWGVGKFYGADM